MAKKKSTYLTDYWTTDDALKFSDFRPALEQILQTAVILSAFQVKG